MLSKDAHRSTLHLHEQAATERLHVSERQHKRRRLSPRDLTGYVSSVPSHVPSPTLHNSSSPSPAIGPHEPVVAPESGGNSSRLVCFGMLCDLEVKVVSERKHAISPDDTVDVQTGKITPQESGSPVGRLENWAAMVLRELDSQKGFSVQTYIHYATPTASSVRRNLPARPSVCAIVYGPYHCLDALGSSLDEFGVYLQDPLGCDRDVEYHNPHRLAGPDGGRLRMTSEFQRPCEVDMDHLITPQDLLAGLESTDDLHEAPMPSALRTVLFSHQRQALAFMQRREKGWALYPPGNQIDIWSTAGSGDGYRNNVTNDEVFERPADFRGGILGDTMGLGKSLTAIALIASDLDDVQQPHTASRAPSEVQTTLLVVKPSLLKNWQTQFELHVAPHQLVVQLHHGSQRIENVADVAATHVVLTTYNTLVEEWKKQSSTAATRGVYALRWRRIILDEAHDIRDYKGATCAAVCAIEAQRRWAVTGTPIQNRLLDVASLFMFLRVYPYDHPTSFQSLTNQMVKTIGQEAAKTQLRRMIKCVMLRRSLTTVNLPPRHDRLCRLDFSREEADLYDSLKQRTMAREAHGIDDGTVVASLTTLQLFTRLRMVCNLGLLCASGPIDTRLEYAWNSRAAQSLFATCIALGTAACKACGLDVSVAATRATAENIDLESSPLVFRCGRLLCRVCFSGDAHCECPIAHCAPLPVSLFPDKEPEETMIQDNPSGMPTKISAVLADLHLHVGNEKCIVLSFWTSTLDAIAQGLQARNIPCIRFDGTIPPRKRIEDLESFSTEPSIRVALLTISCGAVGLDLTAASRAYLMEPQWNPAVEQQALARIHRIGQTRPVTTVRYIMRNSLEEYVLNVQHTKQALASSLISSSDAASAAGSSEFLKAIM